MPFIKARPTNQKTTLKLKVAVTKENSDTLTAYAGFIGEDPDYVVNQLIDTVLAKDREFIASRSAAPVANVKPIGKSA